MKKRIFIIILILIILLASIPINSYASINYQGKAFPEYPKEFENAKYKFMIYFPTSGKYYLFIFNDGDCYFQGDKNNLTTSSIRIPANYKEYQWKPDSGNSWNNTYNSNKNIDFYCWSNSPDCYLIYSNFNMKYKDSEEIFFYKTPLLNFTTMQRAIGGNFWQILTRMFIILIPLGLTIFGAFCVLFLLKSKKWLPVKPSL